MPLISKKERRNFNSRHYSRGDEYANPSFESQVEFQLSPILEGRPSNRSCWASRENFNSRPYSRGDQLERLFLCQYNISTLAHTRGATRFRPPRLQSHHISTLAPTRGATGKEGEGGESLPISTLAHTRGATEIMPYYNLLYRFQLSPLLEGRLRGRLRCVIEFLFQLSPILEGRPIGMPTRNLGLGFQLTPLHEGRRADGSHKISNEIISTLAPTRGATRCNLPK